MDSNETVKKRDSNRIPRAPQHLWQLRVNEDELITRNIFNLSPQGMAIKAPLWFKGESGHTVRLNLKLHKDENFETSGKIVWAKKSPNGEAWHMGIQFEKMLPQTMITNRSLQGVKETIHESFGRYLTWKRLGSLLLGVMSILVMTAAFVTAIYVHQKATNQNERVSTQINRAK